MNQQHCLVFDPIEFKGGSKIATREILALADAHQIRYTIVTRHPDSWRHTPRPLSGHSPQKNPSQEELSQADFSQNSPINNNTLQNDTLQNNALQNNALQNDLLQSNSLENDSLENNVNIVVLPSLGPLNGATHGVKFWLKHGLYLLFLLRLRLSLGPIDIAIGASGPGVDMALYLLRQCLRFRLIQLIHGPVGYSRSIGQCLLKSDQVFYLASALPSMQRAIKVYYHYSQGPEHAPRLTQIALSRPHFQTFTNGISNRQWPSRCQSHTPVIFWCASLLKWKGLDFLLETLTHLSETKHDVSFTTNICYIRPKTSALEISTAPRIITNVSWFNDPVHLDQIRCESNIFISTSQQEPFGLSILEALAAGMCVIIPQDGAYWDKVLTHHVNCLKYQPAQQESLAAAIMAAVQEPELMQRLGQAAVSIAHSYSAEICYQHICRSLESNRPLENERDTENTQQYQAGRRR